MLTDPVSARTLLAPSCSVPELIAVPPVYVLAPDRVTVPLSFLTRLPVPETTPDSVVLPVPSTVTVLPLRARVPVRLSAPAEPFLISMALSARFFFR